MSRSSGTFVHLLREKASCGTVAKKSNMAGLRNRACDNTSGCDFIRRVAVQFTPFDELCERESDFIDFNFDEKRESVRSASGRGMTLGSDRRRS
jgi:hypothetical protein